MTPSWLRTRTATSAAFANAAPGESSLDKKQPPLQTSLDFTLNRLDNSTLPNNEPENPVVHAADAFRIPPGDLLPPSSVAQDADTGSEPESSLLVQDHPLLRQSHFWRERLLFRQLRSHHARANPELGPLRKAPSSQPRDALPASMAQ